MKTKRKPTASVGRQWASKTCQSREARQAKYPTKTTKNQAVPVPGTALAAFLKKYRNELLCCEPTREVNQRLDCVTVLLDAAEVRP